MFNSNDKKSPSKTAGNSQGGNLPSVNMISEGTNLKGNLQTESDIRIAGSLEGEARASGKLIITSSGSVNGDIESEDADIAGSLDGEIHVKNKLVLRQSALIDGDIYTKTLLVEEGARINGTCHMGDEVPAKSTREPDRPMDKTMNESPEGTQA